MTIPILLRITPLILGRRASGFVLVAKYRPTNETCRQSSREQLRSGSVVELGADGRERLPVLLGPLHRQRPQHESPTTVKQIAALEELRLPAVALAVEPQLARHGRPVGGADELEERLAWPGDAKAIRLRVPVPWAAMAFGPVRQCHHLSGLTITGGFKSGAHNAASRLFPEAPNRAAVEHNLRVSIRQFEAVFGRHRWSQTGHQLTTWRDLLRLNLQHVTRAGRHFTNGQVTVTSVHVDGGLSIAVHGNVEQFTDVDATHPAVVPHLLAVVETEREAMELATRWLGHAEERQVPIRGSGRARVDAMAKLGPHRQFPG